MSLRAIFYPFALGCAIAAALVTVPIEGAQTQTSATKAPLAAQAPVQLVAQWPPKPENMVNLDGTNFGTLNAGGLPLQPGEEVTIYTVPLDKWLVITDVEFGDSQAGYGLYLKEQLGGQDTIKLGRFVVTNDNDQLSDFGGGPVGITFQPGSSAIVGNPSFAPANTAVFTFFGYLADA